MRLQHLKNPCSKGRSLKSIHQRQKPPKGGFCILVIEAICPYQNLIVAPEKNTLKSSIAFDRARLTVAAGFAVCSTNSVEPV